MRIALVNDYPVVVEGLRQLLAHDVRIYVVELDAQNDPSQPVDVVLIDTFASERSAVDDVIRLLGDPRIGRVVVYSWSTDAALVAEVLDAGAHGFFPKSLSGPELAEALVRVQAGEQVVLPAGMAAEVEHGVWPGREFGLTAREAEVVGLIAQGFTNGEIARCCYLSINSVKSYIRSAYRKMGVERRSQAVRWGLENGMVPQQMVKRLA